MRASNLAPFLRMGSFVFCNTTDLFLVCKTRLWPRANSLHHSFFRSLSHFLLLKSSVCMLGSYAPLLRRHFAILILALCPFSASRAHALPCALVLAWFASSIYILSMPEFSPTIFAFDLLTLLVVSFSSSLIWFSRLLSLLRTAVMCLTSVCRPCLPTIQFLDISNRASLNPFAGADVVALLMLVDLWKPAHAAGWCVLTAIDRVCVGWRFRTSLPVDEI